VDAGRRRSQISSERAQSKSILAKLVGRNSSSFDKRLRCRNHGGFDTSACIVGSSEDENRQSLTFGLRLRSARRREHPSLKGGPPCHLEIKKKEVPIHPKPSDISTSLIVNAQGEPTDAVGQLHPLVEPQVSHFKQVPLRTIVNDPHSRHISPSYPLNRAVLILWWS
jgi:hypothetical protein